MAAKQEQEQTPDANALIAQALTLLATNQPKREMKEGDEEYVARDRAAGWYDDFFGVTVYQNAYEAQARGCSEETRRRVGQLKGGTYLKGRVTVNIENNGSVVRLSYPVKGDNLLKNMALWSSFDDLIDKIWAEMHAPVAAA